MRILMIGNIYPSPPNTTGDVVMMEARVKGYRERGHDVRVLCSRDSIDGVDPDVDRSLQVVTHALDRSPVSSTILKVTRFLPSKLSNQRRTEATLKAWRPDVADISNISGISIFAIAPLLRLGVPSLLNLADRTFLSAAACDGRASRNVLRSMTGLSPEAFRRLPAVACSSWVRDQYVQEGFDPGRIAILPYGTEDVAGVQHRMSGPVRVLFAGRFVREKGVDVLIDAVARLRHELGPDDLRLTVIGSSPHPDGLDVETMVSTAELDGVVQVRPPVLRADLEAVLVEHDLLVVPSNWPEPFGLVTIEAMAHGLPVIVSAAGALPDLVTDGREGLVIPPGDPEALARALARAVADREELQHMGARGRETASLRFSMKHYIDRMESALASVMESRFEEFAREQQLTPV